jgi:hypothetical protein
MVRLGEREGQETTGGLVAVVEEVATVSCLRVSRYLRGKGLMLCERQNDESGCHCYAVCSSGRSARLHTAQAWHPANDE